MERDRKKSKAHLGSPEPLSEEVEEEEEEEPDDHGQRRKLRGSRALSASYHNRLRSCVLNEKGSPLPHSSRSCTTGAGGGQENLAPIMFAPVMFADHSKCWLGRRHSPTAKDTSGGDPPPPLHQGPTGIIHPPNFSAHGLMLNTVEDRSLLAAAAIASSSRLEKHVPCDSPAPKGRSHRRSLSGASVGTACGLNDSAEALHGQPDACAAGQGQPPQPGEWPHLRGASEGSAQRHGSVFRQGGAAGGDQNVNRAGQVAQGAGNEAPARNTDDPSSKTRFPSSSAASALPSVAANSTAMSKYGIAAFGVPASVQSCFADSMAASAQRAEAGALAGPAVQHHELARCVMSCPEDMCTAATAAGALGRHTAYPAGLGPFASGATHLGSGSGALLELGTEPLVDTSSEPVIGVGAHVRHGTSSFGSGSGKALADSAEELELRRLANQQAPAWHLSRQGSLADQQQPVVPSATPQIIPQQPALRVGSAAHSRPASMGSVAAAAAAGPHARPASMGSAAAAAAAAGVVSGPASAPFDLLSLAHSAGSVFGMSNFTSFSTSGHFSTDAVQGAVGGPTLPQPFNLWPAGQGGGDLRNSSASLPSNNGGNGNKPGLGKDAGGSMAWAASGFASYNTTRTNSFVRLTPPDDSAACEAQPAGVPVLELTCSVGDGGVNPRRDVRTDQDAGVGGHDDADDGEESWLRTSQQAPDPDDPSSAGKYSAVLLRRLQAAAEHEELYGVPASGGHSGAYNFFHLQGSCDSDYRLRSSSGKLHLGSHGSSSMEPSPMPRLSSRIRRVRASPCPGSGGSGGPLTSPAPSHLLGTRSRSAGVTPGGVTCRRLRRRSDLLASDQLGGGSVSARGEADIDELGDSDAAAGADEHMHDAGHQLLSASASEDRLRLLAARMGDQTGHHRHNRSLALPLHPRRGSGSGVQFTASSDLRSSEPVQRLLIQQQQPGGSDPDLAARARSAAGQPQQHRSQLHGGTDFLNGLMDYEDDGVEYMTPPHTPLRGIGGAHDQDAVTAPRAALSGFTTLCGEGPNPAAKAAEEGLFAVAPGRGRGGPCKGVLPQRVSFASHRPGGSDTLPASPLTAAGVSCEEGSSCAQMLMSQSLNSTQEFNRCLVAAANSNDRGAAERLWQEMCSRGITPDINTLNSLLRCLSRSAADPDEAHLLVRDVCGRGGFDANGTSQRLLEEICFRFEQLHGSALG
ncbi:hypothetical protein PLESTF_000839300 [Pleodorina starrii]|nr:hypothetical protein PLESTF_000839300 [Pleodorina starrii]